MSTHIRSSIYYAGCNNAPADIVFVLDSSSSEGLSNFQKQVDFVRDFANQFQIGPQSVQVWYSLFSMDSLLKPNPIGAIKCFCITCRCLYPFFFGNHLVQEETAGQFADLFCYSLDQIRYFFMVI